MQTVVVQIQLPRERSRNEVHEMIRGAAPRFQNIAGLSRKYFLHAPEDNRFGGVYLFETRAKAEAFFSDAWRASIKERFGVEPNVLFFDVPLIVDNVAGEIVTPPAEAAAAAE